MDKIYSALQEYPPLVGDELKQRKHFPFKEKPYSSLQGKCYIGTSGFYYPDWIGNFYPQNISKDKLFSYYVKHFDTVEINSSFYHLPQTKTVETWKKTTPENFIFSFKMSRFITHIKRLNPEQESIKLFFNQLQPFSETKAKHLILIQTPSNLISDSMKLENFIRLLPRKFFYAFEFRHQSWFQDETYGLLRNNNMALVLSDSPIENDGTRLWPYENINTTDFFYIRFHGSKSMYSSSYTNEELKYYAKLIKGKQKNGQNVYAYFNNDASSFAVENAQRLKTYTTN